ncbi:hypothetical protein AAKU61_004047 [Undibacterium sp. GrIS 1.2]
MRLLDLSDLSGVKKPYQAMRDTAFYYFNN